MKVVTVKNDLAEWDSFVSTAEGATNYHQFGWNEIIVRSFGHPCHYLAAIDEAGLWRGVLPLVHMRSSLFGNFLVSLPFVNYGGVLCENNRAAVLLLEEADKLRRVHGAEHVELRHLTRTFEGLRTRQHKVSMILELAESADAQWKGFDSKLRNQIRKAQKSGLQYRSGDLDLIDGFYEVFARNMRDLGTPVYPKALFSNVLRIFPDTSRIFAVFHDGRMIAAGIALWFRGRVEVPWASSIKDYKLLCPNHMLYWQAIQFAIENGFREFDFGRSTPGEGTYNFKKQWGAFPIPLNWQYLMDEEGIMPDLNPGNRKYQAAIRLWRRLPIPITKVLGPLIVRNIP